jgi:RimJ/RimL family protein N-acetyltransferase
MLTVGRRGGYGGSATPHDLRVTTNRVGTTAMLVGKNVVLRLLAEEDLDEFLALENVFAELGAFSPVAFRSPPPFRAKIRETGGWEEHFGRMLLTTKDDRMIGHLMYVKEPPYQSGLEVGYTIFRREDRGKGFMSEALRIFSAYLFELKPIRRLQLGTANDNIASRRVAEKCGYRLEGTLREFVFARGTYLDYAIYAMLRHECMSLSEALAG